MKYEITDDDIKFAEEQALNYMYCDHAGGALETDEELLEEKKAITLMFLWFMERIGLHSERLRELV